MPPGRAHAHPLWPRCRQPRTTGTHTARVIPRPGGRGYGAKTGMDPRDPCRPHGEAAMTEHPNVELTRRGYDAFAKGDLATLSADWLRRPAARSGSMFTTCSPTTSTPLRCACCRLRAGTSRSEFRWPTSPISAMARSPSSGPQQPTRRRASTSGPERAGRPHSRRRPVGFQNSASGVDLVFYAARSYSLRRPPRTGRRWIRFCERSATGWSGRGGRSWRLRWGRRPL